MRCLAQFSQKEIELYEKYRGVSLEQEFQDAFNKEYEIGFEIGVQEVRRELAESLLDVLDNETIAMKTKLTIEEVVKLREGYHKD